MTASTNIEDWLGQYKSRIDGLRQAAEGLRENVAASGVTASSPDGGSYAPSP